MGIKWSRFLRFFTPRTVVFNMCPGRSCNHGAKKLWQYDCYWFSVAFIGFLEHGWKMDFKQLPCFEILKQRFLQGPVSEIKGMLRNTNAFCQARPDPPETIQTKQNMAFRLSRSAWRWLAES